MTLSQDERIERSVDWVATMADRRGLSESTTQSARTIARRIIDESDEPLLPKRVARTAVEQSDNPTSIP
jgi:hypothetical protein